MKERKRGELEVLGAGLNLQGKEVQSQSLRTLSVSSLSDHVGGDVLTVENTTGGTARCWREKRTNLDFFTCRVTFMSDIWLEMFWCPVASSGAAGRSLG